LGQFWSYWGGGNSALADELPIHYSEIKLSFEPIRSEIEQFSIDEIQGEIEYISGPPGANRDPKCFKITLTHKSTYSPTPGHYQKYKSYLSVENLEIPKIKIRFRLGNRLTQASVCTYLWLGFNIHRRQKGGFNV
jgi:hypothetical protein